MKYLIHRKLYVSSKDEMNQPFFKKKLLKIRRKITEMRNTNFSYVNDSSKF